MDLGLFSFRSAKRKQPIDRPRYLERPRYRVLSFSLNLTFPLYCLCLSGDRSLRSLCHLAY